MTTRLMQALFDLGRATCGKLGARLAARLLTSPSWMTILRRSMAVLPPPVGLVVQLGLDDWSFRRRKQFNTPHNLAKTVIEFSVCILRAPLRQRYGVAFQRAPLHQAVLREHPVPPEGASTV